MYVHSRKQKLAALYNPMAGKAVQLTHNFAIYFHHDIIDCSPSHAFRTN
jgi:hypothetical protein